MEWYVEMWIRFRGEIEFHGEEYAEKLDASTAPYPGT